MYAKSLAIAATLFASVGLTAPTKRGEPELFDLFVTTVPTVNASSTFEFNKTPVAACHSGAAIEALCVYPPGGHVFTFNSNGSKPIIKGESSTGNLIFTLPSQPKPFPEPLRFLKNETSNVNAAFFGTGGAPVPIAFSPNKAVGVVVEGQLQYTWYVCPQTLAAYSYDTVSFVEAGKTPTNPKCRRVALQRS